MTKQIFYIEPILEDRIWGGQDLKKKYNIKTDLKNIAEIYTVIAIPNHLDCDVRGQNCKLSEFYHQNRFLFGSESPDMPVRMVLGNSADKLSIQLHPDDEYGLKHSGMRGKPEGCVFLEGEGEGSMVFGHYAKTKEEFIFLAENRMWDKLLKFVPTKKNYFVHIPYGTLHAFGAGGICAAFSPNGDVTYRLHDYDRVDSATGTTRPLHKKEIYDNITVPDSGHEPVLIEPVVKQGCKIAIYHDEPGVYTGGRIEVDTEGVYEQEEFIFMTCINGHGLINGYPVNELETVLIPSQNGPIKIEGKLDLVFVSYKDIIK
jgi:mannose-6-phosphate isomerase